jgi:3-hexulose-6-phosphate synthase
MKPLVQIALDTLEYDHALSLASQAAPYIDILEAGTPLIKSVGIRIVTALKETYPEKIVLADLKSSDVGAYEAGMAFKAGADIITTQGITTLATITDVQREADKWERRAEVDMTGVADPLARSKEVKENGIDLVLYHRSIDEEISIGAAWDKKACQIVKSMCELDLDVSVAGGINLEILPLLAEMPIHGIVVGRGITAQTNPAKAAQEIREAVERIWDK